MVGSAIERALTKEGYKNIYGLHSSLCDLRSQYDTKKFFQYYQPDYVFLVAARVGGILANSKKKASFLYDNLQIQNNVIEYSRAFGVKKLLFLGSSCIYPKDCQ